MYDSLSEDSEKLVRAKLQELIEVYYDQFFLYTFSVCKKTQLVEEILHTVISRLLENPQSLNKLKDKPDKNWTSYIRVCLKHECYSFQKKEVHNICIDDLENPEAHLSQPGDSRMSLTKRFDLLCHWVEKHLDLKPSEYKIWQMMKQGQKPKDITRILGIKSDATRQQIYRLKQKIRSAIPDDMKILIC